MSPRRALVLALLSLAGCGGTGMQPAAGMKAAPTWATAELRADDPAHEVAILTARTTLARASSETLDPIESAHVLASSNAPGQVLLRVLGNGRRAALVQCMALLRAAERERARSPDADRFARRLAQDRDALRAELAALDKSLRELSSDGGAGEPVSIEAETVRVRVERLALSQARTVEAAALSQQAPELLTLAAESARYATLQIATLTADGRGPNHPDVLAARAKVDALEARFHVQLAAEEAWLTALETHLAKAPAKGDASAAARVRLGALLDVLDRPDATPDRGVPSELPLRLRLIAREAEERLLEEADLSRVYGERHPRRLASSARLRALRDEFDRERSVLVAQARGLLARGVGVEIGRTDVRPAQLDEVKLRLAHVLVRMDELDRRAHTEPSVRLVRTCSAR